MGQLEEGCKARDTAVRELSGFLSELSSKGLVLIDHSGGPRGVIGWSIQLLPYHIVQISPATPYTSKIHTYHTDPSI